MRAGRASWEERSASARRLRDVGAPEPPALSQADGHAREGPVGQPRPCRVRGLWAGGREGGSPGRGKGEPLRGVSRDSRTHRGGVDPAEELSFGDVWAGSPPPGVALAWRGDAPGARTRLRLRPQWKGLAL